MRMVLQRVSRAAVRVGGATVGETGRGLLILLAIEKGDTTGIIEAGARKAAGLRIFPGEGSTKMDRSVADIGGEVLLVSQFTLAASVRRGRRPSFVGAAPPEEAAALCRRFAESMEETGLDVKTGEFGAMMEVELVNDGPVTILLSSLEDGAKGP